MNIVIVNISKANRYQTCAKSFTVVSNIWSFESRDQCIRCQPQSEIRPTGADDNSRQIEDVFIDVTGRVLAAQAEDGDCTDLEACDAFDIALTCQIYVLVAKRFAGFLQTEAPVSRREMTGSP